MAKENKYEWSDMFKLDTAETEETKETTETPDGTTKVEDTPGDQVIKTEEVVIEERNGEVEEEEETGEDPDKGKTPEVKKEVKKETKIETPQGKVEGAFASVLPFIEKGFLAYDENKEYENSEDGVKELIQDNINTGIEQWKNQYPKEALEVLEHIKNGGTLNELIQIEQDGPDYERDVDMTDENHQKFVIEDWLTEQGFSAEKIKSRLEKYEEAGLIEDEAKAAHEKLVELQKKKRETLLKEQKAENDRRQTEMKSRTEGFKKRVLETKEVAGIELKKGEQEKLLEYMTKPVKEGKTQLQLDYDDEAQLKIDRKSVV